MKLAWYWQVVIEQDGSRHLITCKNGFDKKEHAIANYRITVSELINNGDVSENAAIVDFQVCYSTHPPVSYRDPQDYNRDE